MFVQGCLVVAGEVELHISFRRWAIATDVLILSQENVFLAFTNTINDNQNATSCLRDFRLPPRCKSLRSNRPFHRNSPLEPVTDPALNHLNSAYNVRYCAR